MNLLHDRHIYRKDHLNANKQNWRCTNSGCRGRVQTDLEVPPQILAIRAEHNHIPDDGAFTSRKLKGALCREAELFPVQSLSQVERCSVQGSRIVSCTISVSSWKVLCAGKQNCFLYNLCLKLKGALCREAELFPVQSLSQVERCSVQGSRIVSCTISVSSWKVLCAGKQNCFLYNLCLKLKGALCREAELFPVQSLSQVERCSVQGSGIVSCTISVSSWKVLCAGKQNCFLYNVCLKLKGALCREAELFPVQSLSQVERCSVQGSRIVSCSMSQVRV